MDLRDRDDAVVSGRMDQVARIDQTQSDAAIDRRRDETVLDVELRRLDRGHVTGDRGNILIDQRLLRIDLLARRKILFASD